MASIRVSEAKTAVAGLTAVGDSSDLAESVGANVGLLQQQEGAPANFASYLEKSERESERHGVHDDTDAQAFVTAPTDEARLTKG